MLFYPLTALVASAISNQTNLKKNNNKSYAS
jgi:hypothetical protein